MNDRNTPSAIRIRPRSGGWAAEGPGYYVWDEDPTEVIRAARELQRGNTAVRPTHRMLVVQPHAAAAAAASGAGASSEALDF